MRRTIRALALIAVSAVFFSVSHVATAHNLSASHEEIVGEYLVDIGYDPEFPRVGDVLLFDLNLFQKDAPTRTANHESAWVRLEQDGKTILATGVHRASFGPMALLLRPQAVGPLTAHVRFENEDGTLAETSFTIEIAEAPGRSLDAGLLVPVGVGLMVLLLVGTFLSRRKMKLSGA